MAPILLVAFCSCALNLVLYYFRRSMADIVAAFATGALFLSLCVYRMATASPHNAPPEGPPVAPGKVRICIAGTSISPAAGHARAIADFMVRVMPDKFEMWLYFDTFDYKPFLREKFKDVKFPPHLKGHTMTSPFVWLVLGEDRQQQQGTPGKSTSPAISPIGGRDQFCEWVVKIFAKEKDCQPIVDMAQKPNGRGIGTMLKNIAMLIFVPDGIYGVAAAAAQQQHEKSE